MILSRAITRNRCRSHGSRPLAYALILLRQDGYPCILRDYLRGATTKTSSDAAEYEICSIAHRLLIDNSCFTAANYAYGDQSTT